MGSRCSRKNDHIWTGGVNAAAGGFDHPFGHRLATRPGMASSLDRVEHDGCFVSPVRVFEASDVCRHHRFDGVRPAPVFFQPNPLPRSARAETACCEPMRDRCVRNKSIRCSVRRDHRHQSGVRTPARCQYLSSRHCSNCSNSRRRSGFRASMMKVVGVRHALVTEYHRAGSA